MKTSNFRRLLSLILTLCMIIPMCVFEMGTTSSAAAVEKDTATYNCTFWVPNAQATGWSWYIDGSACDWKGNNGDPDNLYFYFKKDVTDGTHATLPFEAKAESSTDGVTDYFVNAWYGYGGSTVYLPSTTVSVDSALNLAPLGYTPYPYSITFDPNGGSFTSNSSPASSLVNDKYVFNGFNYNVSYSAKMTSAPTVSNGDKVFDGWHWTDDNSDPWKYKIISENGGTSGNLYKIHSNATFKAKWVDRPKYTLSFNPTDGSGGPSGGSYAQYTFDKSENPTRYGWRFLGWHTSDKKPDKFSDIAYRYNQDTQQFTPASINLSSNKTLYAVWGKQLTVYYKTISGSTISNQGQHIYQIDGKELTLPVLGSNTDLGVVSNLTLTPSNLTAGGGPNQTGATLIGWATGMDANYRASGTFYGGKVPASNTSSLDLYAIFGFPIIFDANYGAYSSTGFANNAKTSTLSRSDLADGTFLRDSDSDGDYDQYVTYVTGYKHGDTDDFSTYSSIYPSGSYHPTRSDFELYDQSGNDDYQDSYALVYNDDRCFTTETTATPP